jgi:hypothetical protein
MTDVCIECGQGATEHEPLYEIHGQLRHGRAVECFRVLGAALETARAERDEWQRRAIAAEATLANAIVITEADLDSVMNVLREEYDKSDYCAHGVTFYRWACTQEVGALFGSQLSGLLENANPELYRRVWNRVDQ